MDWKAHPDALTEPKQTQVVEPNQEAKKSSECDARTHAKSSGTEF